MKKVGIVGFGRFGKLLAELCAVRYKVFVVENNADARRNACSDKPKRINLNEISQQDIIFLAVPISELEKTLIDIAPMLSKNQLVVDVCSVKVYPVKLMKKHIKNAQILGSHPMFGPDSAKQGLEGLKVALCPVNVSQQDIDEISNFWKFHGAEPAITTPEEHDKDTVYSQAFTYSLAYLINNMDMPEIEFSTRSFNELKKVAELSANDSTQLFQDMLNYNPYLPAMMEKLEESILETKSYIKRATS